MQKILVTPQRLMEVASLIDADRDEFLSQYKNLYNQVDRLAMVWQGKDNQAFIELITSYEENFRRIALVMEQYSDFLKNATRGYESCQDELFNEVNRLRR